MKGSREAIRSKTFSADMKPCNLRLLASFYLIVWSKCFEMHLFVFLSLSVVTAMFSLPLRAENNSTN